MSMATAKRTTWAEEWRQTLPEKDVFQHSQNSARPSIVPPCQNREPARDDRKTLQIRPRVGGQRGLSEPSEAESPEGCPHARLLCEGDGDETAFGRPQTEVLELLGWLREKRG